MNPTFSPADVFLFMPDDDCVSRIICKLDDSIVSHAAFHYDAAKHLMAEANLSGIQVNPAPGENPPRTVHVRRYTARPFETDKILAVGKQYLESKEKYAFDTMVLVGLLLISRRWLDDPTYLKMVEKILRTINYIIEKSRKTHPMICSQFVARCYGEAGYILKTPVRNARRSPETSLAERICAGLEGIDRLPLRNEENENFPDGFDGAGLLDSLCCIILKLLDDAEKSALETHPGSDAKNMFPISGALMLESAIFAGTVMRGERVQAESLQLRQAMGDLKDAIDNFITPGDLLKCAQLETVAVIPGFETNAF
jgi:hypothetical protein